MNNYGSLLIALVVGALGGYYGGSYLRESQPATHCARQTLNETHCSLRRGLEKLWSDHVIWTRQFIVSSVAGLKDVQAATDRLLKNQDDLGNAIVPYYGKDAGDKLAKLLREHILIAADIVKAALAKNNAQVKELDAKWHKNADDIATFLSGANPNWPKADLVAMLNEHLKLTTQEVMYRIQGQWQADVTNFDKIFDQARSMALALADGIAKQMPDKF